MRLYGYVILIVLVVRAGSSKVRDVEDTRDELIQRRRNLAYRRQFEEDLRMKERYSNLGSLLSVEKKSPYMTSSTSGGSAAASSAAGSSTGTVSATAVVENPARIAIFNAGSYDVRLKVNYVINNIQEEQQLNSDISEGEHRSVFMPVTATYVRIRIEQTGPHSQLVADEQIRYLNGTSLFCYLLAHGARHPVYGICPSTYGAMLSDWEH